MNCAQRIFEIVDAKPDVVERHHAKEMDLRGRYHTAAGQFQLGTQQAGAPGCQL